MTPLQEGVTVLKQMIEMEAWQRVPIPLQASAVSPRAVERPRLCYDAFRRNLVGRLFSVSQASTVVFER